MNFILYTAVFGNRDTISSIQWNGNPASFICFTDSENAENKNITIINCPKVTDDPVINSKVFKIFPNLFLPSYEYSIWLDGNMRLKNSFNPEKVITTYLSNSDSALYAHPERTCVYEEIKECKKLKLASLQHLQAQGTDYKALGLPAHSGLYGCGFLVRRHNSKNLIKFNSIWWKHIKKYTRRDQISFGFLSWKMEYQHVTIPGSYENNENYERLYHEKQINAVSNDAKFRRNEQTFAVAQSFTAKQRM